MEEKTQVSEVGFEPGTFRSYVEHSNHYATEARPIPDVLLVLVAPKHIHRNVTTTLQSRFTQPHPTGHTLELYYFILFYFFLFFYFFIFLLNFILFYFILFYFIFIIIIFLFFYFADTEAATFRGRPRTSLPSTLCSDLRRIGRTLRQPADIEALRALSREQWRQMERDTSA